MLMVRVFPKCTVQNENAIVQTADFISVHVHTFGTSDGKTPGKIVILSNHTNETDEKCNILVKSLCFLPEKTSNFTGNELQFVHKSLRLCGIFIKCRINAK